MESFDHFVCAHPFLIFLWAFIFGGFMAGSGYAKELKEKEDELGKYLGIEKELDKYLRIEDEIEAITLALHEKDITSAIDLLEDLRSRLN